MNFIEAVGKKVRSKDTGEERIVICYASEPSVILTKENDRGNWIGCSVNSLVGNEWEIVEEEEKKTLSDKLIDCIGGDNSYREQDVKASLRDFIYFLHNSLDLSESESVRLSNKAKKIFGDRRL